MTESININRLLDHHIWSTIETLPAARFELSPMDRGPRTGVSEAVLPSRHRYQLRQTLKPGGGASEIGSADEMAGRKKTFPRIIIKIFLKLR